MAGCTRRWPVHPEGASQAHEKTSDPDSHLRRAGLAAPGQERGGQVVCCDVFFVSGRGEPEGCSEGTAHSLGPHD